VRRVFLDRESSPCDVVRGGIPFGIDLWEKLSPRGRRWGESPPSLSSLWRTSLLSVFLAFASASGRGFVLVLVTGEGKSPLRAPMGEEFDAERSCP
jgi:hypothetical protein